MLIGRTPGPRGVPFPPGTQPNTSCQHLGTGLGQSAFPAALSPGQGPELLSDRCSAVELRGRARSGRRPSAPERWLQSSNGGSGPHPFRLTAQKLMTRGLRLTKKCIFCRSDTGASPDSP